MTNCKLSYYHCTAPFTVDLPLSKSESNRLLLIAALSGQSPTLLKVGECDDTEAMLNGITAGSDYINVGAAGTAMRFLTAYFSNTRLPHEIILDGSERMRNRPIAPLVDALRLLGADINYVDKSGYPPLKINGKQLNGGVINIDSSISSQYISALMMIAPTFKEKLEIRFSNPPVSFPYIAMTASMMRQCGAQVELSDKSVVVHPGKYHLNSFQVEADWSAASYWYELCAVTHREIHLPHLKQNSLQGDSGIEDIFSMLGVETTYTADGIKLSPIPVNNEPLKINLQEMPDVAQTVAVTSALLNKPFFINGLSTLPSKETNRILALKQELDKIGIKTNVSEDFISWNGGKSAKAEIIEIETYNDHRMAMAFAPAAVKFSNFVIKDMEVVSKSYPHYWKQLGEFGFKVKSCI